MFKCLWHSGYLRITKTLGCLVTLTYLQSAYRHYRNLQTGIFFFYTYSLLVGSFFIEKQVGNFVKDGEPYNQQIVLQTLIALITGFVGLIAALPNVQAIVAAKTLGVLIFDVIERVPEVRNANRTIT